VAPARGQQTPIAKPNPPATASSSSFDFLDKISPHGSFYTFSGAC